MSWTSEGDVARCLTCFDPLTDDEACSTPECRTDHHERSLSELPVGAVLDEQYRVGRILGVGGFGITYLAWDERLSRRVAVKECFPHGLVRRLGDGTSVAPINDRARPQFDRIRHQFFREAQALAKFNEEPGIVRALSVLESHGTAYLAMEYLPGQTLKAFLEEQPTQSVSLPVALSMLGPIMQALHAVHAAGWVHGDVAPDNIVLTAQGRIKLLDFGAARFTAGEQSRSLLAVVKPGYTPFEQYSSRGNQGPWTDVHALAATLYRAVTGHEPPPSAERRELDELVPPCTMNPDLPPALDDILTAALAVDVSARTQTIDEFAANLEQAVDSFRSPFPAGTLPPSRSAPPRRSATPGPERRGARPLGASTPPPAPVAPPSARITATPPAPLAVAAPQSRRMLYVAATAAVVAVVGTIVFVAAGRLARTPSGSVTFGLVETTTSTKPNVDVAEISSTAGVPAKQGSELASPGPAPPSLKSVEPASALERQRVDNVKAPEPDFDRQAEAAARAEAERLAELKVINDKTEQDRARERERTAALQAEADKLAKERELLSAQAELDRQARERAAADARAQAETRAQAERAAQERAARERAAANAEATAQFGASVAGKWTYRSEGGGSGDTRQITEEELTIRPDCTGSLRRTFITQSKTFAGWSNSGKDTMELAFRCSGAGVVTGQVTGQFALQGTALSFNGNSYRRR